jgi:hypothetical protein
MLVEFQDLFYSCPKCEDGDAEFDYEKSSHVQPWCLIRLKPLNHFIEAIYA